MSTASFNGLLIISVIAVMAPVIAASVKALKLPSPVAPPGYLLAGRGVCRVGDRVARDANVMRVTGTGAIRASSSVREALPKEEP